MAIPVHFVHGINLRYLIDYFSQHGEVSGSFFVEMRSFFRAKRIKIELFLQKHSNHCFFRAVDTIFCGGRVKESQFGERTSQFWSEKRESQFPDFPVSKSLSVTMEQNFKYYKWKEYSNFECELTSYSRQYSENIVKIYQHFRVDSLCLLVR